MQKKSLIQSIDRAFEALELVCGSNEPMRCSAIAAEMGLEPNTAHNILRSLCIHGYLEQTPERAYLPGPACLRLGNAVKSRFERLGEIARVPVQKLFKETGRTTFFGCEYYGLLYAVVVAHESGLLEINGRQQWLDVLHASAAGRFIIAEKGLDWYADLCRRDPRQRFTPRTLLTPEELAPEVEKARVQGYALCVGEHLVGLAALGVEVRRPDGEFLGVLIQTFPDYLLDSGKLSVPERAAQLRQAAAQITES